MASHHGFSIVSLRSWDEFRSFVRENEDRFQNWLFRGQLDPGWNLVTRLERAATRLGIRTESLRERELGMLRRFQREAHLHSSHIPPDFKDRVAWLAIIQHYGGATRLLDWSYSPYVAAFFALEDLQAEKACAVWAIDQEWLWARAKARMSEEQLDGFKSDPLFIQWPTSRKVLWTRAHVRPLVVPINPFRLNDRLAAQQGVFLVPADINQSFVDNLTATFGDAASDGHALKIELTLSAVDLSKAVTDLHRHNVGRTSLFPGLSGLATHLHQLLAVPGALAIEPDKE